MAYQLISIASHLGEHHDGVETGPGVIVQEFAKTSAFKKLFNQEILTIKQPERDPAFDTDGYAKLKQLPLIAESLAHVRQTLDSLDEGDIPISVIGSDEVAAGILHGVAARSGREKTGIVWIDSHADLNDATTTPSGNIHGMSLALAVGHGDKRLLATYPTDGFTAKDVVLVAAGDADLDPGESAFIKNHSIPQISPAIIREKGGEKAAGEIIATLKRMGKEKTALHFDLDSIDQAESPGVSVLAKDANTFTDLKALYEALLREFELVSLSLAEYNPRKDPNGVTLDYATQILAAL